MLGSKEVICPDHVFSLDITEPFRFEELNYEFEGTTYIHSTQTNEFEDKLQKMIGEFIIPDRNFVRKIPPTITIQSKEELSWWQLVLLGGAGAMTLPIMYWILKNILGWYWAKMRARKAERTRRKVSQILQLVQVDRSQEGDSTTNEGTEQPVPQMSPRHDEDMIEGGPRLMQRKK